MEFISNFIAIPALAVIVYLMAEIYKLIANEREQWTKAIPVFCGLCGAILAVISYIAIPNYIPAENIIVAIAIGISSGLAATGANQIYKQITKKDTETQG